MGETFMVTPAPASPLEVLSWGRRDALFQRFSL